MPQILAWADAFHKRTGRWPQKQDGVIAGPLDEKWSNVDAALKMGCRGLAGGTTLALLLFEHRGARHLGRLPPLTVKRILAWVDAFHQKTGTWPDPHGGVIAGSFGETWGGIDQALRNGSRGLPGGASLGRVLAKHRNVRNQWNLLTVERILAWADAFRQRTGHWPNAKSGAIPTAPGENWDAVDMALRSGARGLPANTTLARLLSERRGKRNLANLPRLTVKQILAWADAHHQRTGRWPTVLSGPIAEAPGETWYAANQALYLGCRGLPRGSSLLRLLSKRRGKRDFLHLPRLTVKQILQLADRHLRQYGVWPKRTSGPVKGWDGTWYNINTALDQGCRGLPGGSSLPRLLAEHRGVPNPGDRPKKRSTRRRRQHG